MRKYEEMFDKTKYLIRTKYDNTDDYDERYMKIRFNLNDDLSVVFRGVNNPHINKPTSHYELFHHL